jgi:hypothetical protein
VFLGYVLSAGFCQATTCFFILYYETKLLIFLRMSDSYLQSAKEFQKLLSGGKTIIICCVAKWTEPKIVSSFFKWSNANDRLTGVAMNTSNAEMRTVAKQCGVKHFPSFIIFENKKLVGLETSLTGAQSEIDRRLDSKKM